jgi:hypothetical protein
MLGGRFSYIGMKKVVFLVTHLGSGSEALTTILNQNPRVECHRTGLIFNSYHALESFTAHEHKCRNSAAIWIDEHVFNYTFSCKDLLKTCKFIYVVRDGRGALEELVGVHGYDQSAAMRYYCYRLRRIAEMARRTKDAVLLTYDDLVRNEDIPLVEEYLNLKERLQMRAIKPARTTSVSVKFVDTAQKCYERYLYKLRQMQLQAVVATAPPQGDDTAAALATSEHHLTGDK